MKKQKPKWHIDSYNNSRGCVYIICSGNSSDRRKSMRYVSRINTGKTVRIVDN